MKKKAAVGVNRPRGDLVATVANPNMGFRCGADDPDLLDAAMSGKVGSPARRTGICRGAGLSDEEEGEGSHPQMTDSPSSHRGVPP